MRRDATTLSGSRAYAALLVFAALILAMSFAVAPAFAEDLDDENAPTAQGTVDEGQHYVAVLYDDGELVIKKADSVGASSQGGSEAIEGQVVNSNDETDGDGSAGSGSSGSVVSQSGEASHEPLDREPADLVVVKNASLGAASNEANCSGHRGCPPPLGPAGLPDPLTPAARQVVATYDDVEVGVGQADHVKWYGNRDKIKRVAFGEGVMPENMAYWFAGLENLSDINFAGLDTSNATSMKSLFDGCGSLKALDAKALKTSNVTNMSRLFAGCSSLVDLDLSKFDTRNVTDMSGMFEGCSSVRALNLSGFDTSNVKSTDGMLKGCTSLAALDASSFSASQLGAMSVPTENKAGFWKLSLPADYQVDVVLRAPTEEEKATPAFLSIDPNGNGNLSSEPNGEVIPNPSPEDEKQKADSSEAGKNGSGSSAGLKAGSGADSDGVAAADAGDSAVAKPGIFDPAPADAKKDAAVEKDQVAQAASAVAGLAQGIAYTGVFAQSVADMLMEGALQHAAAVAAVLVPAAPEMTAVVDSLASPWPSTPMSPFGIPLNALATALLLLVAVPMTVLLLRDRRS